MNRHSLWMVGALCLLLASPAHALKALENAVDSARAVLAAGGSEPASEKIQSLEIAIDRGERASAELRKEIAGLEQQKADLERVQTVLTSGLVGAIVTALVAIIGAFVTSRSSRAERDLKRLEVVEKVVALKKAGIGVPDDIATAYQARVQAMPPAGQPPS